MATSPFARTDLTSPNPQTASPLFTKLPKELRDMIYAEVLCLNNNEVWYSICGSATKDCITSRN